MDIRIDLERDVCACLIDNVVLSSPLRRVFEPAQSLELIPTVGLPITGVVSIKCTEEEAVELLNIAKQNCPGAIYAIEEALRLANSSDR